MRDTYDEVDKVMADMNRQRLERENAELTEKLRLSEMAATEEARYADALREELDRLHRMSLTGTVDNILTLSDDDKRLAFAVGI